MSDPGVRVHEPASVNCSPTGSRPRLCAVRADQTSSPTPWNAVEFDQPPRAANEDLWVQMNGGWIVRVHRSLRTRRFHPVHRTCPVRTSDLEPGRTSVIWWSGAHGWTKNIQQDEWGSEMSTQIYLFKGDGGGWTFFQLKESVQAGASSSEVSRLHPDVIQWNSPEREQPWRPPAQAGASTSSQRRGQVTATERGHLALGVVQAEGHQGGRRLR